MPGGGRKLAIHLVSHGYAILAGLVAVALIAVLASFAGGLQAPEALVQPVAAIPTPASESDSVLLAPAAPPNAAVERWSDEPIYLGVPQTWSGDSRRTVDRALALLPQAVRESLGNPTLGPLYVSVSADGHTLSGEQPYGHAANFFTTNEGRNEVVLFPDQGLLTVLHELGHAYNLRRTPAGSYAAVYLDDEMLSFMSAAGWRLLTPPDRLKYIRDQSQVELVHDGDPIWTDLSRDDALEDFADSFALYFAYPDRLKALSPSRFAWFQARFRG
jgi:hypothetical protein